MASQQEIARLLVELAAPRAAQANLGQTLQDAETVRQQQVDKAFNSGHTAATSVDSWHASSHYSPPHTGNDATEHRYSIATPERCTSEDGGSLPTTGGAHTRSLGTTIAAANSAVASDDWSCHITAQRLHTVPYIMRPQGTVQELHGGRKTNRNKQTQRSQPPPDGGGSGSEGECRGEEGRGPQRLGEPRGGGRKGRGGGGPGSEDPGSSDSDSANSSDC